MASMYAAFLYFYIRNRQGKNQALFLALLFGALAFYSYSPGQVIVVITGILLLISDFKFHIKNWKNTLWGLGLLVILALPYLRFYLTQKEEITHHLAVLGSYWIKPIPFYEKLLTYLTNYVKGFNPIYWFWPNPSIIESIWPNAALPAWLFSNLGDLDRHIMKGYGHILLVTFPFWVIGLVRCFKRFKDPAHRTLIFATLAAPAGAAIVDWGITRGMVFIIPTTIITALGVDSCFTWLRSKWEKLGETTLAVLTFLIIAPFCFLMLNDALTNGPTWYDDYGLGGIQYGGEQVFTRAVEIAQADPHTTVLVSSTWANGTSVIMRYFTDDLENVRMGNINAYTQEFKPLNRNMLFVMTGDDLIFIQESGKFTNIEIEDIILYPNQTNGFFFVRLDYVEGIEEILESERIARQILIAETITLMGQDVSIEYPVLDMNEIGHAFDGDTSTLCRTLEANPMRIVLTFSEPIKVQNLTLMVGGTPTEVSATAVFDGEVLAELSEQGENSPVPREMTLDFAETLTVDVLEISIRNVNDGDIAHVHLWEVTIE